MSDRINDGGPAFPALDNGPSALEAHSLGMTLRDYFAAKAMQGDFAAQGAERGIIALSATDDELSSIAKLSYRMADAMIVARKAVQS